MVSSQGFIIFANGAEIKAFDVSTRRELDVISREKHIDALDFDPEQEMVFWVDSKERKIKRSFMVNAHSGEVKVGYAQELSIKGITLSKIYIF